MKRIFPLFFLSFLNLFFGAWLISWLRIEAADISVPSQFAKAAADQGLEELLPGTDYGAWYQDATGYTPVITYFGVYAVAPVSDVLYLGFGSGRPAEADGALLALYDGDVLTAVNQLDEQGFIDMVVTEDTIFIPGADPCCGDSWDWGNSYVYTTTGSFTKYRNLPNVIHSWGMWYDADRQALYSAVSSHLGDEETWTGELFLSTDRAQSWQRVANRDDGIGDYRTYDVIGLAGELFVIWNDQYGESCGLAQSGDGGATWSRLPDLAVACRTRLFTFGDNLLALHAEHNAFYVVSPDGPVITRPLPSFTVAEWAFNALTVDDNGFLYTISTDGRIMRTRDLYTWQMVANTNLTLMTIAYWPEKNWLIVADRGENAKVWKLDLSEVSVSPAPAKHVIVLIADGWGGKHIEATNAYVGAVPAYQTWQQYWLSTYSAGGGYDPMLAWSDFNYVLQGTTDSAAAATALFTGQKTANGRLASNVSGTERLFSISEEARALGLAVGAVSSVHVSHATPGAWMAHNVARGNNYAIADEGFWGDPNTTGNEPEPEYGGSLGETQPPLDVIIGSGHPNWNSSSINQAIRNKLAAESGQPGTFLFVERIAGQPDGGPRLLAAAQLSTTTRLAGLFGNNGGSLDYRLADGSGAELENPTLAEMTTAALLTLARDPDGFVLMVEGGAVDWTSHGNNMDQMVGEMIGFNESVTAVIAWVEDPTNGSSWQNTLVIVTGDHETGYLTAGPGVFPNQPLGAVNTSTLAAEKAIGTSPCWGSSSRPCRASWDDANGNDQIDGGETVHWAWNSGGHSNSLIPLYARGPGAMLFNDLTAGQDPVRGEYTDNTAVFQVMTAVLSYRVYMPYVSNASTH